MDTGWRTRGRRPRVGLTALAATLTALTGMTGVATAVQRATSAPRVALTGTPANAVRGLHRVGTSNMSAKDRPAAGRYARMPEHERAGADDQFRQSLLAGQEPAAPAAAGVLGGADAPASTVVGNGPTAQGFDALDIVQMEHAGTGEYAGSNGGLEPPDQALCVGNGFVMEGVNQAWRVYDMTGKPKNDPKPITQFFKIPPSQAVPPSSFVSDPRCIYDAATKRWFAITLEADESNGLTAIPFLRSHTYIAVSKTSDPTGDWFISSIDVTDDGQNGTPLHHSCPCIDDQPLMGLDAHGLYLSANQFSDSEIFPVSVPSQVWPIIGTLPDYRNGQAQLYALSKDKLVKGQTAPVVSFDTADVPLPASDQGKSPASLWSSIQPATPPPGDKTAVPASGVEYFMSQLDFQAAGDNRIAVWGMNNTASLGSAKPAVKLVHTIINTRSGTYTSPAYGVSQKDDPKQRPLGDQCGCPLEKLNANDDRMQAVALVNGTLWSALNTALPPINAAGTGADAIRRAGIMYFAVKPFAKPNGDIGAGMALDGYVQVARNNVIFPSIAANPKGAVAMFFTLTGVDHFPSAAWARLDGLAAGTPPAVHVSGPGAGPEDGFTGYPTTNQVGVPLDPGIDGTARWGDYSYAATDEQGCLWGAAEYIPGTERDAAAGNWGTFITRVAPAGCHAPAIVPPAPGQNTNPCGPVFTDPSGDDVAGSGLVGVPPTAGQNPQLDILQGSMALSPDGKTLSTTLRLRDLTTNPAPGGVANEYYVYWDFGGKTYYTNVEVSPSGVTYVDGVSDSGGRTDRATGPADTGTIVQGPNGTVTIRVPVAEIGNPKAGNLLTSIRAETRELEGVLVIPYDTAEPKYDFQLGQLCK